MDRCRNRLDLDLSFRVPANRSVEGQRKASECVCTAEHKRSLVRVYTEQPGQPIQEQRGGQVCPVTTQGRLRTRPRYTSWCTHGVNSCKHIGQRERERVPCLCLFRGHDVCATLNYSDTTRVDISWIQLGNVTSPETRHPCRIDTVQREGKNFLPLKVFYFNRVFRWLAPISHFSFPFSFAMCVAMSNFNINPYLSNVTYPVIIFPTRKSAIAFTLRFTLFGEKYRSRVYIYRALIPGSFYFHQRHKLVRYKLNIDQHRAAREPIC